MIFDTHAHYDDEQFDTDRDELLSSMAAGGIGTKPQHIGECRARPFI